MLTVGLFTYTTDNRFTAVHSEGSNDWTLRIDSAQRADSGVYECQVSTDPKMSQPFHLQVVGECVYVRGSLGGVIKVLGDGGKVRLLVWMLGE